VVANRVVWLNRGWERVSAALKSRSSIPHTLIWICGLADNVSSIFRHGNFRLHCTISKKSRNNEFRFVAYQESHVMNRKVSSSSNADEFGF
jgi:hypothetical protein